MRYDPVTRLLHLAIAVGVTLQMATSLVMVYPKPGRLPNQWFEVHEVLGLTLLALITAHWLWSVSRTALTGEPMMLFPWFSRQRMSELADDIRATAREAAHFRLPAGDGAKPLPAAFQGLGLLLGLFLAATGAVLAFGMAPDGRTGPVVHAVKEAHEVAAPLMWGYLAVHPALAILHQMAGHRTLSRIFGIGR